MKGLQTISCLLAAIGSANARSDHSKVGSANANARRSDHSKGNLTELKPALLDRLRRLQGDKEHLFLSEIAADAYAHLLEITVLDAEGNPNPRITCTQGYGYAADYVQEQMRALGMVPLGDVNRTTYFQEIEGSVNETLCPPGIKNVIGMIPGTIADEYVIYAGHLDGPFNQNPQTDLTRRDGETSNAYDDGLAVAVGLAIAKQLIAKGPLLRSVIILIDDGEEGWYNVGTRLEGETAVERCDRLRQTEWYERTYLAAGGDPALLDSCGAGSLSLIGASYWIKNPTVPLENVKMLINVDPLGSPYNNTSVLTALGGDSTTYNATEDGTLNDFLDEIWPSNSSIQLIKGPRGAVRGFGSSADTFQRGYERLCGDSCLLDGGIPAIWLAEPAFQKYHGGAAIVTGKDLFGAFLGEGNFSSTVYFSEDDLAAFFLPGLDAMVMSIYELVRNTADSPDVTLLSYDSDKGNTLNNVDMENIVIMCETVLELSKELPPAATQVITAIITTQLLPAAQMLTQADLTNTQAQAQAQGIAEATVGIALSVDFFNPEYPEGEAFLDQTFGSSFVADEPSPSASPSSPPSNVPSNAPSKQPPDVTSLLPSSQPSYVPSTAPSAIPSAASPSAHPTSLLPSSQPSYVPSTAPSVIPSAASPSAHPTSPVQVLCAFIASSLIFAAAY